MGDEEFDKHCGICSHVEVCWIIKRLNDLNVSSINPAEFCKHYDCRLHKEQEQPHV